MSAPQTNLEKQRRRHWAPLLGTIAVTVFGVVLIVYWLFEEAAQSDPPSPAGTEAGTVEQPAQSTIPAEAIKPEAQSPAPIAPPVPRESAPVPNAPSELTTE
jgi:hypothetical protein